MQLDRTHALSQATAFERARALGIARATGETLDRYARLGRVFAQSPQQFRSADLARAEPAIRDIAVFQGGALISRLNAADSTPRAAPVFSGTRTVFSPDAGGGTLAVRSRGQVIAVLFDPQKLVPAYHRAAVVPIASGKARRLRRRAGLATGGHHPRR